MATRAAGDATNIQPPSSNFPATVKSQSILHLAYDAATDETGYWRFPAPQGMTGTLTLKITGMMASATTAEVVMAAQLQAVTPGDAVDLDAGTSFDTANLSTATTVPATAGYLFEISITMTNADSAAPGDDLVLAIYRDANHADDDASGDFYMRGWELRDAA